jgi:uncharacterized protein YsxB (DUF464 family)
MITIKILNPLKLAAAGYVVTGHAGAAEPGHDLVCAAVSMLAITCANALETVAHITPNIKKKEGHLFVSILESDINPTAITILQVFKQGVDDLLEAYPDNVQLFN